MEFLDYALDQVPDLEILEAGEHELKITKADVHVSQNSGKKSLKLMIESVDNPNAKDFYHYVGLPSAEDTDKQRIAKLNRLKDVVQAAGLDISQPLNPQELVGSTFWGMVTVETSPEYGEQNSLKSIIKDN